MKNSILEKAIHFDAKMIYGHKRNFEWKWVI